MSLGLHPSLKDRLVTLIEGILPSIKVQNNSFLSLSQLPDLRQLDAALPDIKSTIRQALNAYIGETPLQSFFIGVLSDELVERSFDGDAPEVPLVDLEEYSDVRSVATSLVDRFDGLPEDYSVLVQLRHPAGSLLKQVLTGNDLALTPDFSLVRIPEDGAAYTAHDPTGTPAFFSGRPSGVYTGSLYAKVAVKGYIPKHGGSAALEAASFMVRAFLGLCFAQRILTRGQSFRFGGPWVHHLLIYANGEEFPAPLVATHEFPAELSDALDRLGVDQIYRDLSEERLPSFLRTDLFEIGMVMARHQDDDRLLRAAQWLFDSNAGSNVLLNFVQAMVSLEILLGDKSASDLVGLGELLGNRCAFLVGRTKTQRDKILADFRRIYDTRSRIVHRGHNRLSTKEEDDFWTLRWLCSRVIQEEMKLLIADARERTTQDQV